MTKRTPQPPTTGLPAPLLDDQVIETIGHVFDKFIDQIGPEDSHRHWQLWMRKLVRQGKRPLRWLIELTHDKEAAIDADAALRDMAEEMLERREQPPVLLQSYLISHHAKPARGRGRREGDDLSARSMHRGLCWHRPGALGGVHSADPEHGDDKHMFPRERGVPRAGDTDPREEGEKDLRALRRVPASAPKLAAHKIQLRDLNSTDKLNLRPCGKVEGALWRSRRRPLEKPKKPNPDLNSTDSPQKR